MNQKNPHEINGVRAASLTARTPVSSHFGTSQEGRPAALPGPGFGSRKVPGRRAEDFFLRRVFPPDAKRAHLSLAAESAGMRPLAPPAATE
jgi:hypothetical protein